MSQDLVGERWKWVPCEGGGIQVQGHAECLGEEVSIFRFVPQAYIELSQPAKLEAQVLGYRDELMRWVRECERIA